MSDLSLAWDDRREQQRRQHSKQQAARVKNQITAYREKQQERLLRLEREEADREAAAVRISDLKQLTRMKQEVETEYIQVISPNTVPVRI